MTDSTKTLDPNSIMKLTSNSFKLTSSIPISLYYDKCLIVLFHNDSDSSLSILNNMIQASKLVPGSMYAEINLNSEKIVGETLRDLRSSPSLYSQFAKL